LLFGNFFSCSSSHHLNNLYSYSACSHHMLVYDAVIRWERRCRELGSNGSTGLGQIVLSTQLDSGGNLQGRRWCNFPTLASVSSTQPNGVWNLEGVMVVQLPNSGICLPQRRCNSTSPVSSSSFFFHSHSLTLSEIVIFVHVGFWCSWF
jgi:hypothetical protein